MCAQILEHDNFLSNTVFTNEAKFHISGHVSWHNCVVWGTEPLREHLEHERGSPKVNVWCVLMHGRIIVKFFFDEDIIKSNSFPDMLVIFHSSATTSILFFNFGVHLFILLTLYMTI
jgi:hypothetical protein